MISSYNIRFTFQDAEFLKNSFIIEVKNSQIFFSKNQQQISIQKIILQTQPEVSNNKIIFAITDFSDFVVSNCIDVLQKKIDEIAKRRRIAFLRKTLRKAKIDEKIEFRIFVMFDKICILSMRFESSAKFNREKLYRMINSKKYFDEN